MALKRGSPPIIYIALAFSLHNLCVCVCVPSRQLIITIYMSSHGSKRHRHILSDRGGAKQNIFVLEDAFECIRS